VGSKEYRGRTHCALRDAYFFDWIESAKHFVTKNTFRNMENDRGLIFSVPTTTTPPGHSGSRDPGIDNPASQARAFDAQQHPRCRII
jgi:hypothetical protein